MKFKLARNLAKKLAGAKSLQDQLEDVADDIATRAEANTKNRGEISFHVTDSDGRVYVEVRFPNEAGITPGMARANPRHANEWHYLYQEFGGERFRPPPMPLRRAAESVTGKKVRTKK